MNNFSQETPLLLFNHQTFLLKQKQHHLPDCNSQHFNRLNAVPQFYWYSTTLKTFLQSATQIVEK